MKRDNCFWFLLVQKQYSETIFRKEGTIFRKEGRKELFKVPNLQKSLKVQPAFY
jgi:hypothetical protein